MQLFVCYLGHKLRGWFPNGRCFVATYQQQLSRLATTVPVLKWLAWLDRLRGDSAVETKATLTVARARVKCVLIYSNIENAILCSLLWTQVANFISKQQQYFVATYQQQLSRLPITVSTLKHCWNRWKQKQITKMNNGMFWWGSVSQPCILCANSLAILWVAHTTKFEVKSENTIPLITSVYISISMVPIYL